MSYLYYRHRLPVRIMHWVNVVVFVVMLMSGLMIFNAHPTLYWGGESYGGATKLLQIRGVNSADGPVGLTTVFGRTFETTGVLGAAPNVHGGVTLRAFPYWATIPSDYSLAEARRWHLFFMWVLVANGLLYVAWSIASRHLVRDLAPTKTDLKSIWQSVKDHARFRHARGAAAMHYNVLQKVTYLAVIFVWFPLVILMGFAMSPMLNALAPGWVDLFGGRQSARTLHFVAAFALLAFMALHVFLVITTGLWNNLRSMLDGHYRIRPERVAAQDTAAEAPIAAPALPPIEYSPDLAPDSAMAYSAPRSSDAANASTSSAPTREATPPMRNTLPNSATPASTDASPGPTDPPHA
ncbi:MAG TPA: cytochrome b/b6 domain-containing protein [Pseudomonadales bacterium]|nr:cytochrome b/b6 domain-containing protein [Pseudomonadales bacterium]